MVGVHTDDPTETYYTIKIGSGETSREKGTIESRILKARRIDSISLFQGLLESEESMMVYPASVVSAFRDSKLTRAQLRAIWTLSSQHDAACHNNTRSNGLRCPGFVFALQLIALFQSNACVEENLEKMTLDRAKDLIACLEDPVAYFAVDENVKKNVTTKSSSSSENKEKVVTSETHSQYFERLWIQVTGSLEKSSASPSILVEFFKKSY